MKFFKNSYLSKLFFLLFFAGVLLYALSSVVESLAFPAQTFLIVLAILTLIDILLLFSSSKPIAFKRTIKERLNLGDINKVVIEVTNRTNQPLFFKLYEGFPIEMQERELSFSSLIKPRFQKSFSYEFTPKQRGDMLFNDAFFILSSIFNLVIRRFEVAAKESVKVYPSTLQLKKYELLVFNQQKIYAGIKRIRRLGNNSEFEQIKNFVQGDETKAINWKATSRTTDLMVNKYQEEKSQNVYCILDKSRSMQMEFEDLSLLDYSINAILTLSNIIIKNSDKAGLISFSNKIDARIFAEKNKRQMQIILDALYNQKTEFKDPDYELLYQTIRMNVKTRSLIILFTNFETEESLSRALPTLRMINKKHVLVVVLFQNSDLDTLVFQKPKTMRDVYQGIVTEQMSELKSKLVFQLKQNGIHAVLTLPEELTIQTINKYLELKAKGIL